MTTTRIPTNTIPETDSRTSSPAFRAAHGDRLVFTVAEAGELLGISRAFAYELVARGELPVICLGRRRLVPKVALLALVGLTTTNSVPAGSEPSASDVQ
jgi:excisionase family DNA binding protein